ncbi:MAG: HDIG domain-containing protein [Candidatus Omnitrophica bacterium]|nr:HDIG domain-containing protein [Candidatus Omnitrophota bacterium]MBD3269604.1 HDIG domain-containing protein [Candidatus Omnitrophota bacterium]
MKISIARKQIDLKGLILGIVFFLLLGVTFIFYRIDLSLLIISLMFFIYGRFFRRIEEASSYLDLSILGIIAVLTALISTLMFTDNFKMSGLAGYGIPAIGFAILVTLLFGNLEFSFILSLFLSLLGGSISQESFNVTLSLFAASLAGIICVYRVRRRFQVIRAGLLAGIVQFAVAFLMEEKQSIFSLSGLDFNLFKNLFSVCVINGLISSVVVLGILPVFEYIFKTVTNISLLELSDFNHPLLRRLILEAPGTYQHSLVVANLSEAAAESIGANSLLVRVGAYYHDVGKLIKPDYFVENLVNYRDVHKKLKPSMSKLIIFNHVKEGIELVKKHRLNPKILDFVNQHHGRTLVYYFYQRAKELEPEGKHEEEYRYPGPRPQSKETAIVSLADTVEALSRTLEEPTPSRIEEMVREVVKKRFMEGELDESSLTLKELEKITRSFIRILNAVFHTRINYPKDENREKNKQ